jgi:hypothetical protein
VRTRIAADLGLDTAAWWLLEDTAAEMRTGRPVPADADPDAVADLLERGHLAPADHPAYAILVRHTDDRPVLTLDGLILVSGVYREAGRRPTAEIDCDGVPHYTIRREVHGPDQPARRPDATLTLLAHYYDHTGAVHTFVRETLTAPAYTDTRGVWTINVDPAADLVTRHAGPNYTPSWQGRGWTVELHSGAHLFQVTG